MCSNLAFLESDEQQLNEWAMFLWNQRSFAVYSLCWIYVQNGKDWPAFEKVVQFCCWSSLMGDPLLKVIVCIQKCESSCQSSVFLHQLYTIS
jgi:hypothetical protein